MIGILLGALAAAAGIGVFLAKANSDRKALAAQLEETQKNAEQAREENRRAIENANQKLQEANSEVTKAQELVEALEEERRLIAEAVQLQEPSTYTTYRWSQAVSLDLGISLEIPPGTEILDDSVDEFSAKVTDQNDSLWFSIVPYSKTKEKDWLARLSATSSATFLVHDRVLTGLTGKTDDYSDPNYVLRIQSLGIPSHLVWIRDPSGRTGSRNRVEDIIGTMTFEEQ